MYSIILMSALAGSPDVPGALFARAGCSGVSSRAGCTGTMATHPLKGGGCQGSVIARSRTRTVTHTRAASVAVAPVAALPVPPPASIPSPPPFVAVPKVAPQPMAFFVDRPYAVLGGVAERARGVFRSVRGAMCPSGQCGR